MHNVSLTLSKWSLQFILLASLFYYTAYPFFTLLKMNINFEQLYEVAREINTKDFRIS